MKTPSFDNANEELKYAAQFSLSCHRCGGHEFHLLPTGHTKCVMCDLIYNYLRITNEWVFTTTDIFEEKAAKGEVFSDEKQEFLPLIQKIEEEIKKKKRNKRKRLPGEENMI